MLQAASGPLFFVLLRGAAGFAHRRGAVSFIAVSFMAPGQRHGFAPLNWLADVAAAFLFHF
ncbi:hypothetical protein NS303_00245 [Pantoea ananatis]|nr:hypothetical protein NS303_00245 [Pantoea ananatis]KTR55947.1 hypothetical protein NS311_09710 [Pantoea ananatis]KTR66189.1 hypothetical protein RSA47_04555 [Pantoea ananatis]KTR72774.1 hypothetical protein NS296_01620 [Pantoea ananatis]MDC7859292.1 hypothetical protein [Pantoea ananatis]